MSEGFPFNDQLFVSARGSLGHRWVIQLTLFIARAGTCIGKASWFRGQVAERPLEHAMDWQTYGLHVQPPPRTDEDELGYAAGWTISGLATLGTIIAVWIFAI
jgi:hypothetical protein